MFHIKFTVTLPWGRKIHLFINYFFKIISVGYAHREVANLQRLIIIFYNKEFQKSIFFQSIQMYKYYAVRYRL